MKVFQTVGLGLQHDDRDGELRDVLLKGQATVDGHENIELCLRACQKLTVLDPRPACLRNRQDFMPLNIFGESSVDALVKEDSHEALASIRVLASSRKAITCSRETVGKP